MIKEYHFSTLLYDEDSKTIRCAACGRDVRTGKAMYNADGKWVCGKCIHGGNAPTECALCSTLKAAVEY